MKFKRGKRLKIEHNKRVFIAIIILLAVLIALLVIRNNQGGNENNIGVANPASIYCLDNGGELEMRENEFGEYGVCLFEDGSECEEWEYYREECSPGDSLE